MHRDSNLLFAVFAVQLKKVSPVALMEVAAAWAGDPTRDLPDRLVETGALTESDRRLIQNIVNTVVGEHGGDATAALHSFGGDDQVNQTFHGTFHRTDSGVEFDERPDIDFDAEISIHEIPGRYKELSEHGRGGMGKVLLVHDEALGRDIVLKELLPLPSEPGKTTPARKSASMISRFLQEAKITGQLEHPAIAPVYELGYRYDGTLYYTMKLVRGRTLSQAFAAAKTLRQRLELLPHFIDLCQALAYAHSRGVIHRDLKPANVMLGEFGETVILDWGLAKLRDKPDVHADELEKTIRSWHLGESADTDKTAPGEILGTPLYMAPEQARGKIDEVDHRTDIYALGVMLYQLLTGQTPFPWTNVQDVLNRVAKDTPPPIRTITPDAPPELAAIAHRAMSREPGQRFRSAKDLAAEIVRFNSGALVDSYVYGPLARLKFAFRQRRFGSSTVVLLFWIGAVLQSSMLEGLFASIPYTGDRSHWILLTRLLVTDVLFPFLVLLATCFVWAIEAPPRGFALCIRAILIIYLIYVLVIGQQILPDLLMRGYVIVNYTDKYPGVVYCLISPLVAAYCITLMPIFVSTFDRRKRFATGFVSYIALSLVMWYTFFAFEVGSFPVLVPHHSFPNFHLGTPLH